MLRSEEAAQFPASSCKETDVKKGKAAGKYELTDAAFTGTTGHAAAPQALGLVEDRRPSGTSEGELSQPEKGTETITLSGCAQKGTECSSAGAASGTIVTFPLEVIVLQSAEAGRIELALAAAQFANFACGKNSYAIEGAAPAPLTGAVDVMSSRTEASFTATGEQLIDLSGSNEISAKLIMSLTTTSRQPLQVNTTKDQ